MMKTAKDIMITKVISVKPETPLVEAVNLILKGHFTGLPVIDNTKHVVGVLTEFDLVMKDSSIYLPTFIKLFENIDIYKKNSSPIQDDLKRIFNTKVSEVMNKEPLTLLETTKLEEVAQTFAEHHRVDPIPIVNKENLLTGIISRSDLIKMFDVSHLALENSSLKRDIDKNVKHFINHFEKSFVVVSKYRTHFWFTISASFTILGFIIAWAWIIRISPAP